LIKKLQIAFLWRLKMTRFAFLFLALSLTAVAHVQADELDPQQGVAPQGLIVRDDGHGSVTVFKAADLSAVQDAASAQAAVQANVIDQNQLADIPVVSELDQVTSSEAWYRWWNPGFNNYFYGYNYYGYNYYYQPCYSYGWGGGWGGNWGGYNYRFYRRR
jgi:hypothetical protein